MPTLLEATGEDYPPPWFGLFAPAGTPLPILDKIHAERKRITSEPAFRQKNYHRARRRDGLNPPDEFEKFIDQSRALAARSPGNRPGAAIRRLAIFRASRAA